MKQLLRALFYFFAAVLSFHALAAEESVPWKIRAQDSLGEVEYDPSTGDLISPVGVVVTYGDTTISAEKMKANEQTGDVFAEGSVIVKKKNFVWYAESVAYNFKTGQSQGTDFKTGSAPIFMKGRGMGGDASNRVYTASQAFITGDNYAEPAYKIKAREMIIVPDDYYEAHNATLYLGDVPVFFLPYYKRSLKRHPLNWEIAPGYRSLYGPYLLNTFNWAVTDGLDASLHLDYREKRGLAGGPEFSYRNRAGEGNLLYYYLYDDSPETLPNGRPMLGPDGKPIPHERDRFYFSHLANITTNLSFKTAIRYQSDAFIVRDFFEGEFRENVQPNTFAELTQLWSNWVLDAFAQPQINDFFETVERLPDVKLTGLRQQILETPLFYESESSIGYYRREFVTDTSIRRPPSAPPLPQDFSAMRADSFHQVVLPHTFLGWLNVTPRAGERVTYYSEAGGRGGITSEETRNVFNTGAETSFTASRLWKDVHSDILELDGLRHIIQPSLNYVFVPEPNVRPAQLPQFDYELPSLRPLALDYPDYNAIDSVDSQNVVRLGLLNKLQTKREKVSVSRLLQPIDENEILTEENESITNALPEDVLDWNMLLDWRLDPRTNQTTFSDFFSDLTLRPRSWLTLSSETRTDLENPRLVEADHHLTLSPTNIWALTLGHRFLDDPRITPGHNLLYENFAYRFNENWAFGMTHYYEAELGVLQRQSYTLYRDLRSWTAALTLRFRDGGTSGKDDFTIGFIFSLKSFPTAKVGSGQSQHFDESGRYDY